MKLSHKQLVTYNDIDITKVASVQVLFTISKEKLNSSWKYGMTVIILDVLQVCLLLHQQALVTTCKQPRLCFDNVFQPLSTAFAACSCLSLTLRTAFHGHSRRQTGIPLSGLPLPVMRSLFVALEKLCQLHKLRLFFDCLQGVSPIYRLSVTKACVAWGECHMLC